MTLLYSVDDTTVPKGAEVSYEWNEEYKRMSKVLTFPNGSVIRTWMYSMDELVLMGAGTLAERTRHGGF